MKNYMKTVLAWLFVTAALPFVLILLLNGRQKIHQEKKLDQADYEVIRQMLAKDVSWMSDDTLKLLAVLYRTEQMRLRDQGDSIQTGASEEQYTGWQTETYGESYARIYQAVENTAGMVVKIHGEYKELPFHKVSAGRTRDGQLLGTDHAYIQSVECREDKEAQDYLQVYAVNAEEIRETLAVSAEGTKWLDQMEFQRDEDGYVESVSLGEKTWTGEAFRTLLHLPSSCFWLDAGQSETDEPVTEESVKKEKIKVTVMGSGHGFGISLYAADRWIREGTPWQDIFSIFYKNAQCITIP